MNKKKELQVGDKVLLIGETEPLIITQLIDQKVRINSEKEVIITRVYFGVDSNHKPVFDWKIKEKVNG